MKIIFKKPFISRAEKERAKECFILAETYFNKAETDRNTNVSITSSYMENMYKASEYINRAATLLGFRNVTEMYEYEKIHGKILD